MIPHSKPLVGEAEAEAAARVVRSGMLAQGPECEALEAELSAYLGTDHVVAVSSGSAALHLALLALDIGTTHTVGLPSYVCSALLNACRHAGATPALVDLPESGYNVDARGGPASDALIVPHMFGQAASLDGAPAPLIEDCAMAVGASTDGQKVGTIGDVGVFSFYATKVLCAGEGGALCTGDGGLADRLRDLRDYDGREDGPPRFNYKLTDVQAAVARVQLRSLDGFIARRRAIAARYDEALADAPVARPDIGDGDIAYRYVIRHETRDADELISAFETAGIAARKPVFLPLHRMNGDPDSAYPNTTAAYLRAVSIPIYPALTDDEVDRVVASFGRVL